MTKTIKTLERENLALRSDHAFAWEEINRLRALTLESLGVDVL